MIEVKSQSGLTYYIVRGIVCFSLEAAIALRDEGR
jgi:hypothetical protein